MREAASYVAPSSFRSRLREVVSNGLGSSRGRFRGAGVCVNEITGLHCL
jgi:hypothetical protein